MQKRKMRKKILYNEKPFILIQKNGLKIKQKVHGFFKWELYNPLFRPPLNIPFRRVFEKIFKFLDKLKIGMGFVCN